MLDCTKIALDEDEDDFDFLHWEAMALLNLNELEEAYGSISRCIAAMPEEGSAWYNLACYYAMKDEKQNAIDKLTVAIHLDDVGTAESMADDPMLDGIRDMPEFIRLLEIDTL